MARFTVVLVEHGYGDISPEREIVEAAGGKLIDAEQFAPEQLHAALNEADGILVRRLKFDASFLAGLPKCKIIVRYGVGVDNIDLQAATKARIIVGHVPFYCQDEVSSHAIGLLLAASRHIVSTNKRMAKGGWDLNRNNPVFRMSGKTLGLVGFGTLAQAVAQKMQGWAMHLIATDPYVDPERAEKLNTEIVSLEELLNRSDFISLHTPLIPETYHLMNPRTFQMVKRGAILVNTARGQVVDEKALVQAVEDGIIAAAGIDVFEQEPLPDNSPLRNHPRIIVTDHMAWYSEESQLQLQKTAAEEVVRGCTGALPRAIANPEVLVLLGREEEWEPTWMATWQRKRGMRNS